MEVAALQQNKEALSSELQAHSADSASNDVIAENVAATEAKMVSLQQELSEQQRQLGAAREEIVALQQDKEAVCAQLQQAQRDVGSNAAVAEASTEAQAAEIAALQQQMSEKERQLEEAQEGREALSTKLMQLRDKAKEQIENLRGKLTAEQEECANLRAQLGSEAEVGDAAGAADAISEKVKALQQELYEREQQLSEANEDRNQLDQAKAELEARLEKLREKAKEQIRQLRDECESLRAQVADGSAGTDASTSAGQISALQRDLAEREQQLEETKEAMGAQLQELRDKAKAQIEQLKAKDTDEDTDADGSAAAKVDAMQRELGDKEQELQAAREEVANMRQVCEEQRAARAISGAVEEADDAANAEVAEAAGRRASELRAELAEKDRELQGARAAAQAEDGDREQRMLELQEELSKAREDKEAQESRFQQLKDKAKDQIKKLQESGAAEREECGNLRARLAACSAEGSKTAASVESAIAEARSAAMTRVEALQHELDEKEQQHKEDTARLHQDYKGKIDTVVKRAKDHVKEVQARLETSTAENRELTGKYAEKEEAYTQQHDKVLKYQQLMAQAKARIDDYEKREKEMQEALSKSQAQRLTLQEQMGSMEKNFSVPPGRDAIVRRGGILIAVETENNDVWCLINTESQVDGNKEENGEKPVAAEPQNCWWLLSQLDVDEKPVPLQRRWKGEVSALRTQMQRFKKKSEELQDEFEAYKVKANAALTSNTSQLEEIQKKEREVEQLGEQLHSSKMDLQRALADRGRAVDETAELKRQLQEETKDRRELERSLDRQTRHWEEKCEASLETCRRRLEAEKASSEQAWYEKERSYQKELDLRRAEKEVLEEEVETLQTRLNTRKALADAALAEPPVEVDVGPESDAAAPEQQATPEPEVRRSPAPSTAASVADSAQEAQATEEGQAQPALPAQAYSLHTSVAWQDLVNLRTQVRQLEANLQEERKQTSSDHKEIDLVRSELQEMTSQQRLQNTVGQHQQMEYIRNVFRKFVETLPPGNKEHDQLIPVLMTFFKFADEDSRSIHRRRTELRGTGLWGALSGLRGAATG